MSKILIIPSWYPRPDDRINGSFFQEQARLVSDQFEVKVLFFRFSGRPSIRSFATSPLKTARAWLRFLFQHRSRTKLPEYEVFTNPPLIEYSASSLGFTAHRRYNKHVDSYIQALSELIKTGWKPDLIHAHSVNLGGLAAHRIKEVYGIPYVITEHIPFALSNFPEFMRDDIKAAFSKADKVLSLGGDMVRQLGMSDINIEPNLVYNFVDENFFQRLCQPYQPGMPLLLVSIGAASHYKDHRTLLRAIKRLKDRGIPFKLTLIGLKVWGSLYDETLGYIRENGLIDDVTIVDKTDRYGVSQKLPSNQIFVMTSIFETFCVSMIEAMACGLAVVTTNHGGGAVDLVTNDVGAVVPVRNDEKIAETLERIYEGDLHFDPRAIREHVISICGTQAFGNRLTAFYEAAMNAPHDGA